MSEHEVRRIDPPIDHYPTYTMNEKKDSSYHKPIRGWEAVLGSSVEALALFRISLGILLVCELVLRFRFLHVFYSEEGCVRLGFNGLSNLVVVIHDVLTMTPLFTGRTMPLRLLLPKIDSLYKAVCLHCHFAELWEQQILLGIQTTIAVLFTLGYKTRIMAVLSWYLYTSLILRNTWLYFILDRYFYYLLFAAMFLPLDERFSLAQKSRGVEGTRKQPLVVSPGTVRSPPRSLDRVLFDPLRFFCLTLYTLLFQDWNENAGIMDLHRCWWWQIHGSIAWMVLFCGSFACVGYVHSTHG